LPYPAVPATPGRLDWPTWADVAAEVEGVYERISRRI
jgi:hypothetical protein